MKRVLTFWSIVAVLFISLFGLNGTSKVEAAAVKASIPSETTTLIKNDLETKKEEIASQIKIFDEYDNEIHPYTLEELKGMLILTEEQTEDTPIKVMKKTYSSGYFDFSSNIWLGGGTYGRAFKDPTTMIITSYGTAKKFSISARHETRDGPGKQAKKISVPGGWKGQMHFNWSLKKGKSYRFNFVNEGSTNTTVKIKETTLWYN
ncbi:hypothetical protein [Bacillus swezeyi]|uniref:Uncharacterized protein n=1 Tax=Bacillus swezeyi TaxID=1925020 RepID=A0A5M8RHL5_9BACI|nr:hypothetical protein [Bacillus swezeyi]KAA6446928.1 hypothetical protein DX927_23025 [Bacillus swezeyi]KAA6471496.1 hypothetical protein DX928_23265 [Bacillus swezeyi]